jgi:hypothetical protein
LTSSKSNGTNITKFIYEGKEIILEVDANNNELSKNIYGLALVSRTTGKYFLESLNLMQKGRAPIHDALECLKNFIILMEKYT